jgi:DNA-binding CsgD family transcriptional regulator
MATNQSNVSDNEPVFEAEPGSVTLTPLELHVFVLLWQGKRQYEIATAIQRSRRQVTRVVKQITEKLQPFDMRLLLYRLEDELFKRIPAMSDRDLIAALKLYRLGISSSAPPPSITASNRDVQSFLREVIPRDHADSTSA